MRLLNTLTGRFVEVHDPSSAEYAVLSHTWDQNGEQSYHDVRQIQGSFYIAIESVVAWAFLELWWRFLFALSILLQTPRPLKRLLPRAKSRPTRESIMVLPGTLADIGTSHKHVDAASRLRRAAEDIRSWNTFRFSPRLSIKIRRACAVARAYGHRLIWIDSCCIDKTSSSELSESINSMYAWYRDATVCYAFLADVSSSASRGSLDPRSWTSTVAFRKSRWFRRGWTLQELIAPRVVVFLSTEWQFLGTKSSLAEVIEEVTGIYGPVLRQQMPLSDVPVAKRMSWAARRETTRKEDEAYSLLGIFDISMSPLYGEGARAFVRLQEEIMKRIPDQTLFAWAVSDQDAHWLHLPLSPKFKDENSYAVQPVRNNYPAFFAPSPRSFRNSSGVSPVSHDVFVERAGFDSPLPSYTLTPYGIHTSFPLVPANSCFPPGLLDQPLEGWYFAILACELEGREGSLLAVICSAESSASGSTLLNGACISMATSPKLLHRTTTINYNRGSEHRIVIVDSTLLRDLLTRSRHLPVNTSMAYVPVENPPPSSRAWYAWSGTVQLTEWSTTILRQLGYAVSCSMDNDSCHTLALAKGATRLSIRHRRSRPQDPQDPFVDVWVSSYHLAPRPSVTLDLRKIRDSQEYAFEAPSGRCVVLRFTLSYMFISFFLDVEVLDEQPALPRALTATTLYDPDDAPPVWADKK
ncbi:HET-domain-containing protein [Dichomitus squalens LYAD-421 SS1]|uniref:HET-domain-containing protein n=1 Tax=Dichomitus squalens (strain LYAD-421) TaxID=732165 RepID=R7SP07_DICSQ|nr:HET-domain-containing protein [Dichomitus squalens LYAD-421 SS1]EJF56687.1 HET-domain-containing protein [Dichomitus squalens LYAD-421 SS1]